MRPLPPNQFEARRIENRKIGTLSLVRFNRNDYSVPTKYAHREATVIGSIDQVRIVVDTRVVAEHVRDWEAENVHYDPIHYLGLLQKKPNSLDYGRPFEQWSLPESFSILRRRLESECGSDGRREFIKILRLLETHKTGELGAAIERALDIGAMTVDVVQILLREGRESPAKLFRLDGRQQLQDHNIPEPNIAKYGHLLKQREESNHPAAEEQRR